MSLLKTATFFVVISVSAALLEGCGAKTETATNSQHSVNSSEKRTVKSTADIGKLLAPSIGTNEIVARFGHPQSIQHLNDQALWRYDVAPFPADDAMRGTYVIGVTIGVTNGHLAYWGCVYREKQQNERIVSRQGSLLSGDGRKFPELKFFVVSTNPIPEGRWMDTDRFPKLGYISSNPTLTIRTLKEVSLEERSVELSQNQSRTFWAFRVELTPEDVPSLRAITATNVLKTMLITVEDEPVIAPRIMMPLEKGVFEIKCDDRVLMEVVKEHLAKMQRQTQ
jgi:hypothetical protein